MPFQFRKEAIEEDLNTNFPSQGQGNPPLYYSLSEVVVPTYSINSVAEGSGLPEILQTAWDFSTGASVNDGTTSGNVITNPGFWKIGLTFQAFGADTFALNLSDGLSSKVIFRYKQGSSSDFENAVANEFVVFVRSGDSVTFSQNGGFSSIWYRQIAQPNGTLVNPLGFSFA